MEINFTNGMDNSYCNHYLMKDKRYLLIEIMGQIWNK